MYCQIVLLCTSSYQLEEYPDTASKNRYVKSVELLGGAACCGGNKIFSQDDATTELSSGAVSGGDGKLVSCFQAVPHLVVVEKL